MAKNVSKSQVPEVVNPRPVHADADAQDVSRLLRTAENHGRSSVLCSAIAGAIMLRKSETAEHGTFGPWLESVTHADGRPIPKSTAYLYMNLAKEMATRIAALPNKSRAIVLALPPHDPSSQATASQSNPAMSNALECLAALPAAESLDARYESVLHVLREIAPPERSLRGIMADWGIVGSPKGRGGDNVFQKWLREFHPDLECESLKDLTPELRKEYRAWFAKHHAHNPVDTRALAAEAWNERTGWLYDNTFGPNPTYGHLSDAENEHLRKRLFDVYTHLKREPLVKPARKRGRAAKKGAR